MRVFVSGCFDVLHAGHIQFFEQARALGTHLTVSVASEESLWRHKHRRPSIPDEHKIVIIGAISAVDQVVLGEGGRLGLDFEDHFRSGKPDILAVNPDDPYLLEKRELCEEVGARLVILDPSESKVPEISSSSIVRWMKAPEDAPLRVDFAGGWLDVPKFSMDGAWIVNCAISPLVSLRSWNYQRNAGLGGSGAWALLNGRDGVESELDLGVGWQDPAVIRETGLCVWRSGLRPALDFKSNGSFLEGKMALRWTGNSHDTPGVVSFQRDFEAIKRASIIARAAVKLEDLQLLSEAVKASYQVQLGEGMVELPEISGALATKYCGGGHGGYALILFPTAIARNQAVASDSDLISIEPFIR